MHAPTSLLLQDLTRPVIRVFFETANELGTGFLEAVCQRALVVALREAGFTVKEEVRLPVWFRGRKIAEFEPDILIEGKLIIEVKAAGSIEPWHEAQLLNYLRASDVEVGLLLNFGRSAEFKRFVYENSRKQRTPKAGSGCGVTEIRVNPR